MRKSRFDERCPHCEVTIDVYDHFVAYDYATEFTFDCPQCDEGIQCTVHMDPEFELSDPRRDSMDPPHG